MASVAGNPVLDMLEEQNGIGRVSRASRDKFDGLDAWASSEITMIHFKIIFMFLKITLSLMLFDSNVTYMYPF